MSEWLERIAAEQQRRREFLLDVQMSIAGLRLAAEKLQEHPDGRMPYLAGALRVAAHQMEQMQKTLAPERT